MVTQGRRGSNGRTRVRRLVVLVASVMALLVSTSCEIIPLNDGGFLVTPDGTGGPRVLIIGDSLIRQPSIMTAIGVLPANATTLIQAVNTSGLVSGPTHWDARAAELIAQFDPDIVLIGFVGNFAAPYWTGYSPPGAVGSPEYNNWISTTQASADFVDRYTVEAQKLTGLFELAGVKVYWVEPPPFPPAYGTPSVPDKLWARWKVEIPTAHPSTKLLSARSSISTSGGAWMRYKVFCNTTYEIRSYEWDGGVHFTADGAGTYGRALVRALAAAEGWPQIGSQCPGYND